MRALLFAAVSGLLLGDALAAGVPFWGARQSMPVDTAVTDLKHGEFIWYTHAVPDGPMLMVVSLNEQRAYVYRNGVLIARHEQGSEPEPVAADRIDIPQAFLRRVFDVLTLGTTVLVTDEPITPQTTGASLDVINADEPES